MNTAKHPPPWGKLVGWLFFKPSAWVRFVHDIDSGLRPDFSLVELPSKQLSDPGVRRLMAVGLVVNPLVTAVVCGLVLWFAEVGDPSWCDGVAFGVGISLTCWFSVSMAMSVGGGVVTGLVGGVALGVAQGLLVGLQRREMASFATGVGLSVATGIASRSEVYRASRRAWAIVAGAMISAATLALGFVLVYAMPRQMPQDAALGLVCSVVASVVLSLTIASRSRNLVRDLVSCWLVCGMLGVAFAMAFSHLPKGSGGHLAHLARGLAGGGGNGLLFCAVLTPTYAISKRIAGPWAAAVASTLGTAACYGITFSHLRHADAPRALLLCALFSLAGVTLTLWRPILTLPLAMAWDLVVFRTLERSRGSVAQWLRRHSAFRDEHQRLPLYLLDRVLVLAGERDPEAGRRAMEELESGPQRWAVLRARTVLIAREAAYTDDLARLAEIVSTLPEGRRGYLAQTHRLREMVGAIALIQYRLKQTERAILRDLTAQLLVKEIENFRHQVTGFDEPLVSEFLAAATAWAQVASHQAAGLLRPTAEQPIPQVFRAGDPVDRDTEAFVLRDRVVGELEGQIMLGAGCPGIVLYGRRRTGKTTLIRNLTGFLPPSSVRCVWISMLDASAFSSFPSFCTTLLAAMTDFASPEPGAPTIDNPLAALAGSFRRVNDEYRRKGMRLLIAIDEYEAIDKKIGESTFPADLLAVFRESIQSHRNLTWLFAGSREVTELPHAHWASYLVSSQTVNVPLFDISETRLLLTDPLRHSTLWFDKSPSRQRPTFLPEFWGDQGIERIHNEAGGWPHLVQLLAETAVKLVHDEDRRVVDRELLTRAFEVAADRGNNVLMVLMENECRLPGEWDYLKGFCRSKTQPPPQDEAIAHSLRRRLLVIERNGFWRLRVPLMRRWLLRRL